MSEADTTSAIKDILSWLTVPALWVASRANRQRLSGARVEAVAVVMRRDPEFSVLMVRSVYDKCWMFPQEGVLLRETILGAAERGLLEECGIAVCVDGKLLPDIHLRNESFVGSLELPKERWGERAVVGNAGDGPLSHIMMKKKAYWAVFLLAGKAALSQPPIPNGVEVDTARWCTFDEAIELLRSNRPGKAALLTGVLRLGMRHLVGARAGSHWQTL